MDRIPENYDLLQRKNVGVLEARLDPREIENLNMVFSKLKKNYYHNQEKIKSICKF